MTTTASTKCQFCTLEAAYLFKTKMDGHWALGCTGHWMEHRADKKLGESALHVKKNEAPPPIPEGGEAYVPPAKPAAPAKAPKPDKVTPTNDAAPTADDKAEKSPKVKKERAPKVREWKDLAPGAEQQSPRDGSVLAVTLALMASTEGGATLEEVQAALDAHTAAGKHDALQLITWANENRGHGFTRNADTKRIQALIPNPKKVPEKKPKPAKTTPTEATPTEEASKIE